MPTETGDIVRQERLRRGWSMREAADAGGCSHTYWDSIERNEARKPVMVRNVVAQAFDWPDDWVEHPPPTPEVIQRDDEVLGAIEKLGWTVLQVNQEMLTALAELRAEVDRLRSEVQSAPPGRRRQS